MVKFSRLALPLALICVPILSQADRLIFTPLGQKIPQNKAKIEFLSIPSRDVAFGWIGVGVTNQIELELTGESFDSDKIDMGVNLSFNYISPITDIAPGISFGFQDVTNNTADGRSAYLAVTYHFGNTGELNQNEPTIFTLGLSSRDQGFLFFNFALPLSEQFRIIGEHDSFRISAGVEFRPFEDASLKFLFRDGSPMIGMNLSRKF